MFRVWYSTESFADYVIQNTDLANKKVIKHKIFESDASRGREFHTLPDHIKQILYLDSPDLIIEYNSEPIFSVEISSEAGTGHNAFQRFARLAASVENNVPSLCIYPEAAIIKRVGQPDKWDKLNPLIFKALEETMNIYDIPALLFYFPSDLKKHTNVATAPNSAMKGLRYDSNIDFKSCPDSKDPEIIYMFNVINEIIKAVESKGVIAGRNSLMRNLVIRKKRAWMNTEYVKKNGSTNMSPLTATETIDTAYLLNHLAQFEDKNYSIGELLKSREKTVIYKVDAHFRGDPYPGALAAIDYLLCREGKSFEERRHNLVLLWGHMDRDDVKKTIKITGESTIRDFVNDVHRSEKNNLLTKKEYKNIKNYEIPRYYMQVRYGSTFSKTKHVRIYGYFADAILFPDGSLWRDG